MPKPPTNNPTYICAACGAPAVPHAKWAANDEGLIFCVHVDEWPEYYWDQEGIRTEFCSAVCVLNWLPNKKETNQ